MNSESDMFDTNWWFQNNHVQSCYGYLFNRHARVQLRWQELILPDGDFVDVAWAGPSNAPVVILLHGLEGSIYSHYIQYQLESILACGYQVVVMHYRTCSGRLNRLAKAYHAGDNGDFSFFMQKLEQRFPEQNFLAIGFSLGGNLLLKYLSDHPHSSISAAMAVSVPFELIKCAKYTGTVYRWRLLSSMKQKMLKKHMLGIPLPIECNDILELHTLYEFDEALTAPLNGFASAKEYYHSVSSRYILQQVKQPVVLVHAVDDPMIPPSCIPSQSELPQTMHLELSKQGGHVGFIQGYPWQPRYWLKERTLDFLRQYSLYVP